MGLILCINIPFFISLQVTSAFRISSEQHFLFRRLHFSEMRKVDSGVEVSLFSSSKQSFLLSVICTDFLKLPEVVTFGSSWMGKPFFCSTFTCVKRGLTLDQSSNNLVRRKNPNLSQVFNIMDHQKGLCRSRSNSLRIAVSGADFNEEKKS